MPAPRRSAVSAIAIALALAALAGCGSGSEPDARDLAGRLPVDRSGTVAYADLAEVRERGGQPEDVEPLASLLAQPGALDLGQVEVVASNGFLGPRAVTVVRTDQPFEGVAAQLEQAGVVAAGEEGLIAMGSDRQSVEAALAADGAGGSGAEEDARATLFEELGEAPVGSVYAASASAPPQCLRGIAIGYEVSEGAGELLLAVEGADPDLFVLDDAAGVKGFSVAASFEFGEAQADGDLLRVPFTYPPAEPGGPLALLGGETPPGSFYACRGAGAE